MSNPSSNGQTAALAPCGGVAVVLAQVAPAAPLHDAQHRFPVQPASLLIRLLTLLLTLLLTILQTHLLTVLLIPSLTTLLTLLPRPGMRQTWAWPCSWLWLWLKLGLLLWNRLLWNRLLWQAEAST